jgi:hypothetical protein
MGKFQIRMHPDGGFTAFGSGLRERGSFCPNDEKIMRRVREESAREGEAFSKNLKNWIGLRGIKACGKRSNIAGKKALGIEGPFLVTKRGKFKHGRVPDGEIEAAIRDFWPEEKIKAAKRKEPVELNKVTVFTERFSREYRSAQGRPGKFRGHFERVYPGCYPLVARRLTQELIDVEEIREELKGRISHGLTISEKCLQKSDREGVLLYKKIRTLVKHLKKGTFEGLSQGDSQQNLFENGGEGKEKPHYTFGKFVERLVGRVRPIAKGARKLMGNLSEELVHFYIRWARLIGHRLPGFSSGEIYRPGAERFFIYGEDKRGIADIRIGNQPIEIKSGLSEPTRRDLADMIDKYTPGNNRWEDGEPMEDSVIVFHTRPSFYSRILDQIKEAGITVRTHEWFTERLGALIPEVRRNYRDAIRQVRPRIGGLDYLLALTNELVHMPGLLMQVANSERRGWTWDVLRSMALKAKELKNVA